MAVELVDRTMIELSLENPAFRPVIEKALIGKPEAILLVEFAGQDRDAQLEALRRLNELMSDLGLPGSVVNMPEAAEQKALWNVRKAGLNIMMSMKGDGKPVSFIEDCAVPLEHLAEYTAKLTEVFNRYGTEGTWYAHAGGRHATRSPHSGHAPRRGAKKCVKSQSWPLRWYVSTRARTRVSTATVFAVASGLLGSLARPSMTLSAK